VIVESALADRVGRPSRSRSADETQYVDRVGRAGATRGDGERRRGGGVVSGNRRHSEGSGLCATRGLVTPACLEKPDLMESRPRATQVKTTSEVLTLGARCNRRRRSRLRCRRTGTRDRGANAVPRREECLGRKSGSVASTFSRRKGVERSWSKRHKQPRRRMFSRSTLVLPSSNAERRAGRRC